jgi:glutamate dehydrogenase (NAD(P)+)
VGPTVVAISDVSGGLYNAKGLDIADVQKYIAENRTVKGYKKADVISNEDLLELDVDILVPAAIEEVITRKNAFNIKARIILEMANGPTDFEADKILNNKGVVIIPDILANSGGVATSFFEWFQNVNEQRWQKKKVLDKLRTKIEAAVSDVVNLSKKHKSSLREAAYTLALQRIQSQWIKSGKLALV